MKKVIVTGANGFIGSSLIKKMIEKGIAVVALDMSFAESRLPQSHLISIIETDLYDADWLYEKIATDTYDAFYHLAWRGVNGIDKANINVQLDNIKLAINCAKIAKRLGCKKLLCAGTIAEQALKSLPYLSKIGGEMTYSAAKQSTHLIVEIYCKSIELDFVWMQFSNIYGPTDKTGNLISYTIDKLKKGADAKFGPATQWYDFIYIDDLIEAVVRLGEYKTSQSDYFIGSGEPKILKEYLMEIGKKFGREDLIRIGERQDDGIVYNLDMFDNSSLVKDIGNYVSKSFSDGIKFTLEHY